MVDVAPFTICNYTSEASPYLNEVYVEEVEKSSESFYFECFSGFNVTEKQVPTKVDDACESVGLTSDPDGVRSCSGEPFHEEFF